MKTETKLSDENTENYNPYHKKGNYCKKIDIIHMKCPLVLT